MNRQELFKHLSLLWIAISVALALVPAEPSGASNYDESVVPPDASLSIDKYMELGVPDPRNEWSSDDLSRALTILDTVQRAKLPRFRSSVSGVLFDRLLNGIEAEHLTSNVNSVQEIVGRSERMPTVQSLYKPLRDDGLLFDREVLEIEAAGAAETLEKLSEMEEREAEFSTLAAAAPSNRDRDEILGAIEESRVARDSSQVILLQQLLSILEVSMFDATRKETRSAMLVRVEGLVPQAAPHLSQIRRAEFADALLNVAAMERNRQIEAGLASLSGALIGSK